MPTQVATVAILLFRNLFNLSHKVEILLEVFSLEAGRSAAIVVRWKIFEFLELTGQKTAAERAIGDESDTEFATGWQNLVFGIARPERVLGLDGRDGMNLRGATKCLSAGLGESDVANLALLY